MENFAVAVRDGEADELAGSRVHRADDILPNMSAKIAAQPGITPESRFVARENLGLRHG